MNFQDPSARCVSWVQHGAVHLALLCTALMGAQQQECRPVIKRNTFTSLELQRCQRGQLSYSDADCGAFISRERHAHTRTHTSPCMQRLHGGKWTPASSHRADKRDKSHIKTRILSSHPLVDLFLQIQQIFQPHTCRANAEWESGSGRKKGRGGFIQASSYRGRICIKDVVIANYTPGQIRWEHLSTASN